jgi:hypothetical protein
LALGLSKIGVVSINDIIVKYSALEVSLDLNLILISMVLFLIIFFPYESLFNQKFGSKKGYRRSFVISLFIVIVLLTGFCYPIFSDALINGAENRFADFNGWYCYPEVTNYFNNEIMDNGVTIGYFNHDLTTFANRSVIDLNDPVYGSSIYSKINGLNETQLAAKFDELNVKYLLIPTANSQFYSSYIQLTNNSAFASLVNSAHVFPLKTFKYDTLYRFYRDYSVSPLTYSNVQPWNYNSTEPYILNQTNDGIRFYGFTTSNGRLAMMLTFNGSISIPNVLQLNFETQKELVVTFTAFSNLQNRTTDFINTQGTMDSSGTVIVNTQLQGQGNFSSSHVEGLLIGIKTDAFIFEEFTLKSISGIYYQ